MFTLARSLHGLRLVVLFLLGFTAPSSAAIYSDNFNNGTLNPNVWNYTQNATVRGNGETGFLDGHALWFGGAERSFSGWLKDRRALTKPFDTLHGGTLNFSIKTGDGSAPWWNPIDWRYDWVRVTYRTPSMINGRHLHIVESDIPATRQWQTVSIPLPPEALSEGTFFIFQQRSHDGLHRDHWAIDNVVIQTNEPGSSWSHPLPPTVSILRGRAAPSGDYHCLLKATDEFELGGMMRPAGIYLARAGADGAWHLVSLLPTADPNTSFEDMAVDGAGNLLLCGSYTSPIFGLPSSVPSPNAFLAKFSPTHQLLWARAGFNATGSVATFRGLCLGTSGEISVAGRFHQFMRFGPNGELGEPELHSGENNSSLVVRYDVDGNYQWARRLGDHPDTDPDTVWGIQCDPSGSLYVYGDYYGTLKLSDAAVVGEPSGASTPVLGFVAKLSSAGGVQWLTNVGFSSEIRGLAVNGNGLFAAGLYTSAHFDPTESPVAPDPSEGVFLASLNPSNGSVVWARTSSSGGNDFLVPGECLALDQGGKPHLAHTFEGDCMVAGQAVSADPGFNILVTRWNLDGSLAWHKRAGRATITSMDTDDIGQVFLSGQASDLAAFESNAVLADPDANFLHKFNNIFEATPPVGAYVLRGGIPANTPGSTSLGELIAKDADGSGTYSFSLIKGDGDTHNSFFSIGGAANNELLLADGLRLVPGDQLSLRTMVTDENTDSAESIITFTVDPSGIDLWAGSFGTCTVNACASGPNGEFYVTGIFLGTLEFGPWSVTTRGSSDFFIAKYASDGSPAWILRGGSTTIDRGLAITVDSAGNCYACGNIGGDTSISRNGGGNIADFGSVGIEYDDLWVASFSEDGALRWLVTSGGTNSEQPAGITHDEVNDRTYVTGYFRGTTDFGGYALRRFDLGSSGTFSGPSQASAGGQDAFVARYDGAGVFQWVRFGTGSEDVAGNAVAVDGAGAICVTGRFKKNASFNGTPASTPDANTGFPTSNAFLWKLLPNGGTAWHRHGGAANNNDEGLFIGVDSSNRITMAGRSFGSNGTLAKFGGTSLAISDGWDPVLITYDTNGLVQSGHIFHQGFQDTVKGFEVFPNGSMMLASNVSEMNDVPLAVPTTFLQIDSAGSLRWSASLSPTLNCAAFAPDFAPHAVGAFVGSVEIAGEVLTDGSNYTARLAGPVPASAPPDTLTLGAPQPGPVPGGPQRGLAPFAAIVNENTPLGSLVAPLAATDPDSISLVFQFIEGDGSEHNAAFRIDGSNLVTATTLNFEERSEYMIRLRVVDETRETLEQSFVIGVADLPDSIPATITLSDLVQVFDGQPHGATAATSPPDIPLHFTYDGSDQEPTVADPYALVANVDHPDYSGSASDTFWIHTPIQNWLSAFFPANDLNDPAQEATLWGDLADPEVDLVPNLLEAYYGSNPATSTPGDQQFRASPQAPSGDYVMKWQRSKTPLTAVPTLQWSLDLITWYDSGQGPSGDVRSATITVESDLGDVELVRASLPSGSESALFMRLAFP